MSVQPTKDPTPATGQAVAVVALVALALVLVGTVVILAVFTSGVADRGQRRDDELSAKLDTLAQSQQLVIAQLGAENTTSAKVPTANAPKPDRSSGSVVPFKLTDSEIEMGVTVAVARFLSAGDEVEAGWPLSIHLGNYLDGSVGFGIAASHGDVFKGTYYVDESTQTVKATLLRGAPVNVYGWEGSKSGQATKITSTDLARALRRDDSVGARWRDAWFWVKISRRNDILAAFETLPQ